MSKTAIIEIKPERADQIYMIEILPPRIAVQKTKPFMPLAVRIRNRNMMLEGNQKIMRMQV